MGAGIYSELPKEEHMMYYHIAETLKPVQAEEIEVWEKIAVILKP